MAVQRIYAALALQAQEQGAQAKGEHARALQSVKAGDGGTPGFRLVGTAQDPVPVMRLGERRAASSRYRTVVVAPKDAVLAECEGGDRTKPPSATAADIAAELREGEDAEDAPLTPQEQAALTTDMAELCELGSAPPAMDGAETDDGVETEPEPAVEAPPASDAEEEEGSSEEEEDRPCRSRRARSVSSAQPTQSTSRASKQPRSTSSSAGSRRGNAPCPRPKRSASRTASAGAPAPKRGGKKK